MLWRNKLQFALDKVFHASIVESEVDLAENIFQSKTV